MCQLLGMNCAAPTDFRFSLRGFCKRGGKTDVHSHGWGLSTYGTTGPTAGIQSFHDILPACQSPIAQFVQDYPMTTYNMMAHIRYATQGEVSLENVHPFVRVWKGIQICFAHNGECSQFASDRLIRLGKAADAVQYNPVGDTDSEAVFCALLNAMTAEFPDGLPSLSVLHEFLQSICTEIIDKHNDYIRRPGVKSEPVILNFLMALGPYNLFAYSMPGKRPGSAVWNGLYYIIRQPPFSTARLLDDDYKIDFSTVTTPSDRVAVIVTKPLTCELAWTEFTPGQLILFNQGVPYVTSESCNVIEKNGFGLYSKTAPVLYKQLNNNTTMVPLSVLLTMQGSDARDDQIVENRYYDSTSIAVHSTATTTTTTSTTNESQEQQSHPIPLGITKQACPSELELLSCSAVELKGESPASVALNLTSMVIGGV